MEPVVFMAKQEADPQNQVPPTPSFINQSVIANQVANFDIIIIVCWQIVSNSHKVVSPSTAHNIIPSLTLK
jgi:hypothetical protein